MSLSIRRRQALALATLLAAANVSRADFTLTLLHHSDGESALISAPSQPQYGGIARFKTKLDQLRSAAGNYLTLSNGDMFLAGAQLDAVLSNPAAPFYDALAQDQFGYNAMALANHEFDFGPAVTRRYLDQFAGGDDVWLGVNVDYSAEPALADLVGGKLLRSTVASVAGQQIGIIGVMMPELRQISSPGAVTVDPNYIGAIQSEVDAMRTAGINKIVVMGQLQSITNDVAMIPQLRGVDVVISGGGEELLANPGVALVPGDSRPSTIAGMANQYPLRIDDADGKSVALIGGAGKYKYIGKLDITFDDAGDIISASGDPVRVASIAVDPTNGVAADPWIQANVVDPVNAHTLVLQNTKIARTGVPLEGRREIKVDNPPGGIVEEVGGVRYAETNIGNLMADALRWQAAKGDGTGEAPTGPIIGLQNGGGIRNNSLIPAASGSEMNFSRFDAFSIAAFSNFVAVAHDLPASKVKLILEHSVANLNGGGQFGQWSGLRFTYGYLLPAGSRILDVFLDDGTQIIDDGRVLPNAPLIDLATIDFLATGGDAYPLTDLLFDKLTVSYEQALENYIVASNTEVYAGLSGLNGIIDAVRYRPVPLDQTLYGQGGRRIDAVPEPGTIGLIALAAVGMLHRRRRA